MTRIVREGPLGGGGDDVATLPGAAGVRATEKALLVRLADGRERWVPKSVIHDDSFVHAPGTAGALVVEGWWARKEGLAP